MNLLRLGRGVFLGVKVRKVQMSGVFAELELRIIRERVRSGVQNAKAKGVKLGRPQTTAEQIPQIFYRHYLSFKSGSLNLS